MPEDSMIIEEEALDAETIACETPSVDCETPNSDTESPMDIHTEYAEDMVKEIPPEPIKVEPPKNESPHFEFNRTEAPKPEPPEMTIEKAPRRSFRFRREDIEFSRDKWILTHINSEDLLEYLKLEQERSEQLRTAKDIRGKRLMSAFQLAISLAAIVAVVYLLRDVPTILVNILYIFGIIAALWLWKNPRDKK